ncbi:MAG: hypothetical protein U0791_09345 [Gemmataceae bacterium]
MLAFIVCILLLQPEPEVIANESGIVVAKGQYWIVLIHERATLRLYHALSLPKWSYPLNAIRIGDRVMVTARAQDFAYEAEEFKIERRPKGTIPLAPTERETDPSPWHARMQAEQDWEEKGVAIPHKYLDQNGRYLSTNPPFPAVAPAPRSSPDRRTN